MLALCALFGTLPAWIGTIGLYPYLGVEVMVWIIFGLGFNLLLGYGGLPSFGHGAYFGVGAYAFGLLQQRVLANLWFDLAGAVLVAGVALVLGGLGAHQAWLAVALVVAGALPAVWAFVHLVPEGTVRLRPGLPAAVAARGILTFAFFGTDAYVSLAVTDAHDADTWVAGLALTGATLAWTTGAWVQQRLVLQHGPRWLVRRGLAVIAVGIAGMIVALGSVPVGVTVLAWTIGGLGIGLCYAPISATVLGCAAPGEEGKASASLQLTDVLGVSLGTGLAGVFVALGEGRGWATGSSLTIAFLVTLAVAVGGVLAAGRLPRRLPGVEV
jgi:ABC-type branched-subunit amino acid transport system permease subunit